MKHRALIRASLVLAGVAWSLAAGAGPPLPTGIPDELGIEVELGPIVGAASDRKTITFNRAARYRKRLFDGRDSENHVVVGVSLRDVITTVNPPKAADTIVLYFANGMEIAIARAEQKTIDELFIAFEHGSVLGEWQLPYRLKDGATIPSPVLVYQSQDPAFSPLRFTDTLRKVRFVTRSAHEAELAQPTRQPPTSAGWHLYRKYCSSCHGLGTQGARYAPDFISDMDAYRRVPALAETDTSEQPSLHEKVSGAVGGGRMPPLGHVPNRDIVVIWRWLHSIHRGATK